jgi:hypothetical protein
LSGGIIAVAVLAVLALAALVIIVGRRAQSGSGNAEQLRAVAAAKLGRFAVAALAPQPPAADANNAGQWLRTLTDGIAALERRASAVGAACAALAEPTAGLGRSPTRTRAILARLARLPEPDAKPDALVKAIGRYQRAVGSTADSGTGTADGLGTRVAARLSPADPHAAELTELLAAMARLGLDSDWPDLPSWARYRELVSGRDAALAAAAHDLARKTDTARARAATALEVALAPLLRSQDGDDMPPIPHGGITPAARDDDPQRPHADMITAVDTGLRQQANLLGADLDNAIAAWRASGEAAWSALTNTAGRVKRDAARALRDPGTGHDAADPVRAAAAVMCVDETAAANLAGIARNAIPKTPAQTTDFDASLRATEQLFAALQRNDTVLSGLDGIIVPLLAATGADGAARLSAAMTQLTPVPAELGQSLRDLATYSHHPLHGISPAELGKGFLHHLEGSIWPGWGSAGGEHGVMGLLSAVGDIHAVFGGSLLFSLVDGPEVFGGKALEAIGSAIGSSYAKQAAKTPALEHAQQHAMTALEHMGHAAGLALPEILHGLVSHVPVVTVALSATREIRLYQEQKTTLDRAILNVGVDTGGVVVGIGAAELGLHAAGALWHPFAPVQIAVTATGAIIGRSVAKQFRLRHWKKARAAFEALSQSQAGLKERLAADLAGAASATVDRERALYLAAVGYPELLEQAEAAELATLTTRLRDATASYAGTVQELVRAAQDDGSAGAVLRVAELPQTLRAYDEYAGQGQYAAALLTLTKDPLPVPGDWRPGREYRELCWQTASRISELSDASRIRVARWATRAGKSYRQRSAAINAVLEPKVKAVAQQAETARAALEAAAETVRREAVAARVKTKE